VGEGDRSENEGGGEGLWGGGIISGGGGEPMARGWGGEDDKIATAEGGKERTQGKRVLLAGKEN